MVTHVFRCVIGQKARREFVTIDCP